MKFLVPNDPEMDLNGGVLVIETGRVFGGDSGYFYVGEITGPHDRAFQTKIVVTRHDPTIESIFGDIGRFTLEGELRPENLDPSGREIAIARLSVVGSGAKMAAQLTKVSELP